MDDYGYGPDKAEGWPEPTVEEPTMDELTYWMLDGVAEATDGCPIEPDGVCEHGYPSWLLYWGLT